MEKLSKKHSKRKLLRILKVSRSSYYYNQKEKRNQREIENEILLEQITLIWQKSHKRYGSKKVHAELQKLKLEVNLKRVKRLMRENRLFSIIVKKYKVHRTNAEDGGEIKNKLKRDFSTEKLNEKWVSDITYIHSEREGRCYLSSIMDLKSNRIISHKVGKVMDVELVMKTLEMATYMRGSARETIIHTDRGSQYLSKEYRKYCKENKLELSYSRKGNPYDNACIESFHATLKKEYVHHKKFKNLEEIRQGIFEYIESWYNRKRIQEKLGYLSPVEYEEQLKKEIKINRAS